jgi:hypothetical protein
MNLAKGKFEFEPCGPVEIRGRGTVDTYLVIEPPGSGVIRAETDLARVGFEDGKRYSRLDRN